MKNNCIIAFMFVLFVLAGCSGQGFRSGESKGSSQPTDTIYTEKAAMNVYGTQPERALQIIDSAELLGNLTAIKADYLRALVYSRSIESMQYDSAILIAERLMENDEVLANDALKEDVLEVLLNACRLDQDFEQALYWAPQLRDSYQADGKEIETLRIDAEIGTLLVNVGQQEEGMAKIEAVIQLLDLLSDPKTFNNLDATIIALKRKVEACFEMELYDTVIPTAQRMLKEVEAVIREYPGIKDATVQAFDYENGGKYIAAYIVSDEQVDIKELNAFIGKQKPPYMIPAATMQIDAIPLNQNPKVNRKALPAPVIQAAEHEYVEPKNEQERLFTKIFGDILSIDKVSATDNFFELGGTSLMVTKVIIECDKAGYHVIYGDVFTHPTPQSNTVGAFKKLAPHSKWPIIGYLGVLSSLLIFASYSVVAEWTLEYIFKAATNSFKGEKLVILVVLAIRSITLTWCQRRIVLPFPSRLLKDYRRHAHWCHGTRLLLTESRYGRAHHLRFVCEER